MSESYSVLIIDMAHYMDEEEERTVGGFPDFEAAKAYARNRVRSAVEELRAPGQSPADLRRLWFMFGEDAVVVGGEESYRGSQDLDEFIERRAATGEQV
ncbi:MAG TPA: hypothetical protein VE713_05120 [Pyrinomonadaceae bacterium]|nr:hypothetical protein [Pyrinomonadaceae bacterium]